MLNLCVLANHVRVAADKVAAVTGEDEAFVGAAVVAGQRLARLEGEGTRFAVVLTTWLLVDVLNVGA